MRVNTRRHICPQLATVVSSAQMLSFGRVYNRSCSVRPTVPVHFCELGDAGTLFADNHRCRNAVSLRPKALQPLTLSRAV